MPGSSSNMLRSTITTLLLAAALLCAPPAAAGDHLLTREQAVELVQQRTSGRILGVDTANDGEFRVRVLVRQGEVRVFRVNRETGRVR